MTDEEIAGLLTRCDWAEVKKLTLQDILRVLTRMSCNFTVLGGQHFRIMIGLGELNPAVLEMDRFHDSLKGQAERTMAYGAHLEHTQPKGDA